MDQDRHDLTDIQVPISLPLDLACRKQLPSPTWHKGLAKVVDIAK